MGRLPYIDFDTAPESTRRALEQVRERRGFFSNVHLSLAQSLDGLDAFENFSQYVNGSSRLDAAIKEPVILRVAQLVGNEYEWRRHVAKAVAAGLTPAQIAALGGGERQSMLPPRTCAALALVDEYLGKGVVDASTFEELRRNFADDTVIEILLTMGWYLLVSALVIPLDVIRDDPPRELAVPYESRRGLG